MIKHCALLILFSFFLTKSYPQNFEWFYYSFADYITALQVEGDSIWVGTTIGLARINKRTGSITLYDNLNSGLPNNNIYSLTVDKSHNKWVGTNGGGLVKYNGTNWTIFNTINSPLPGNILYSLIIDNFGNKWIGTNKGLAMLNDSNWTIYDTSNAGLPNNIIYSLACDSSGNIWIGTANELVMFDNKTWLVFPRLARDGETTLIADNSGNVWIGTGGGGLVKYDGNNWTTYATSNSGLLSDWIKSLTIDDQGEIWIGTWGGGLSIFDGLNWKTYTTNNSALNNDYVLSLLIDNVGNKWIGTYGGGLAVFNEAGIVSAERNTNLQNIKDFYFFQNYPNPFNPSTTFSYQLPANSQVTLKLLNILGQEVETILNEFQNAGFHSILFTPHSELPSDIYFCHIQAGEFVETKKIVLIK
jgi:ligand-binding sensor domain-containing protein